MVADADTGVGGNVVSCYIAILLYNKTNSLSEMEGMWTPGYLCSDVDILVLLQIELLQLVLVSMILFIVSHVNLQFVWQTSENPADLKLRKLRKLLPDFMYF